MNQGNEITGTIIIIKNTRKSDTAKMYINIFKKYIYQTRFIVFDFNDTQK